MSDELIELPEGWEWAAWEQIGWCQNGRAFPSKEYQGNGIKLLRPGNLHESGKVIWTNENTRCMPEQWALDFPSHIVKGRELVINLTAQSLKDEFLGRICLTSESEFCLLNQRIARLSPIEVLPEYILWLFKSKSFRAFVDDLNTGSLIQHMFTSQIERFELPLAPLNEQKRIVAQIEELRDRTHKAKAALDAIPELCDRFRQSVLASAFRGDLTADWREQNPDVEPASVLLERIRSDRRRRWEQEELGKFEKKGKKIVGDQWKLKYIEPASIDSDYQNIDVPEFWEVASVEQVTHRLTYGITVRPKYVDRGIPLISAREIRSGEVNIDLASQISVEDFNNLRDKCKLLENDILFSKTGTIGHVARVKTSELLCVSQNVALLSPLINPKYLEIILRSPAVQSLAKQSVKTTAIPDLQLGILSQFPIPLPPSTEQEQVVIEVHRLFLLIDTVEEQAINMASLKQVLDQSILAKAFQGELVEQDPNDEPASVLLDRIREEREAQQPKKTKAKGRKKAE